VKKILSRSLLALLSLIFAAGCFFNLSAAERPARAFQLHADSDEFWHLIDPHAKLSKVAGGFGFTEGPVWDPAGFLYVSDEEQNKIYKVRKPN
jgi:gluconolactonase